MNLADSFNESRAILAMTWHQDSSSLTNPVPSRVRTYVENGRTTVENQFDVDNTLATALIDRLIHHGEAIVIQGDSFRMKDKDPNSTDE